MKKKVSHSTACHIKTEDLNKRFHDTPISLLSPNKGKGPYDTHSFKSNLFVDLSLDSSPDSSTDSLMKKLRPTRTLFSPQDVINSSDSDLPTNKSTSMTNSPEVRRQLFGNDDNTTSQTIENQQHLTKVSDT